MARLGHHDVSTSKRRNAFISQFDPIRTYYAHKPRCEHRSESRCSRFHSTPARHAVQLVGAYNTVLPGSHNIQRQQHCQLISAFAARAGEVYVKCGLRLILKAENRHMQPSSLTGAARIPSLSGFLKKSPRSTDPSQNQSRETIATCAPMWLAECFPSNDSREGDIIAGQWPGKKTLWGEHRSRRPSGRKSSISSSISS